MSFSKSLSVSKCVDIDMSVIIARCLCAAACLREDIFFFKSLGANGATKRFDKTDCGGAISNAVDAKNALRGGPIPLSWLAVCPELSYH